MSTDLSTPRTLYLLDDNADFRATAKWWLSGAGYDVIEACDGIRSTGSTAFPAHSSRNIA